MTATTIESLDTLGAVLRQLRHARGWSQPRAAQHLNMPTVVLGSYERGDRNPPVNVLVRILAGYGLHLAVVDGGAMAQAREERVAWLRRELAQLERQIVVTPSGVDGFAINGRGA